MKHLKIAEQVSPGCLATHHQISSEHIKRKKVIEVFIDN